MDLDTFKNKFVNKIQFDYELAKFTWFGVGGKAEILFIVEDLISLSNFLKNKYHLASNLLLKCIPSTIICFAFITLSPCCVLV